MGSHMKKFFIPIIVCIFCIPFYCAAENLSEADGKNSYQLETLTVTAEKRTSNIQDVGISITAFSEDDLNNAGIIDFKEAARFSPNVYIKDSLVVIRGMSQVYCSKTPGVGIFQDGISMPVGVVGGMDNSDLFDIERIEILKGPQGTLYGKNSEAGVVNIITKEPGNEYSGKLFSEYSWYDTEYGNSYGYIGGGTLNYPVVKDKLFLRIAGKWRDYGGFVKNIYNNDEEASGNETLNGRMSIKWKPVDRWDISLLSDKMYRDYSMADFKYINGDFYEGRHRVSYNGPYDTGENKNEGQTIKVEHKGKKVNFLSLTGRRYYENTYAVDFDLTSAWDMVSEYKDETTDLSQEFRISSVEENDDFKWLVGLYAFDEDMEVYQSKLWKPEIRSNEIENKGYAFFGQGTYSFFERLHLTAGLRYDYIDSEGTQDFETSKGVSIYGEDFENSEILPKIAVSYDFSDKIMGYTSFAKGYLPGGYNSKWATAKNNLMYDAEYNQNYEIGLKCTLFDKRLVGNISAFYIEMDDKQVAEWDASSGVVGVNMIKNAANAHSQGLEFDLKARPMQGLDFMLGVGFIEAEIDDWTATEYDWSSGKIVKYDYSGKKLPNIPSYTFNIGVQYRSRSGLFCRGDLLGTGDMYSDSKNSAKEGEYKLVNLRFGYESENFDIVLWCKNFFDEEYLKERFAGMGDHQGLEGKPRMIGTSFTYRF